jgi:hypothetical protein
MAPAAVCRDPTKITKMEIFSLLFSIFHTLEEDKKEGRLARHFDEASGEKDQQSFLSSQ